MQVSAGVLFVCFGVSATVFGLLFLALEPARAYKDDFVEPYDRWVRGDCCAPTAGSASIYEWHGEYCIKSGWRWSGVSGVRCEVPIQCDENGAGGVINQWPETKYPTMRYPRYGRDPCFADWNTAYDAIPSFYNITTERCYVEATKGRCGLAFRPSYTLKDVVEYDFVFMVMLFMGLFGAMAGICGLCLACIAGGHFYGWTRRRQQVVQPISGEPETWDNEKTPLVPEMTTTKAI